MKKVLSTVGSVSALIANDDFVNRIQEFSSDIKKEVSLMDCLKVISSWAIEFQFREKKGLDAGAPLSNRFVKLSTWEDGVLDFAEYKFSCYKDLVTSPVADPVFAFNYLSPDGITISPENFATIEEATIYLQSWVTRYEKQGYYSSKSEKISLDSLVDHCEFVILNNGVFEKTGLSYLKIDPEEIETFVCVSKRRLSSQTLNFLEFYTEFKGEDSFVNVLSAAEHWDVLEPLISAEIDLLASACVELGVSYVRLY